MPVDLSALARDARDSIDVPPMPFAVAIAARAATARPAHRSSRLFTATLGALSLVAAAAGAAQIVAQSQIVISATHGVVVRFDTFGAHRPFVRPKKARPPAAPTAAQIRSAVRAMDFPVTLPAGIPGDRGPSSMLAMAPGAIMLYYDLPGAWRASNHLLPILLANPHDESNGDSPAGNKHRYELRLRSMDGAQRWRIGGEDVIVFKSTITASELARLHRSMLAAAAKRE